MGWAWEVMGEEWEDEHTSLQAAPSTGRWNFIFYQTERLESFLAKVTGPCDWAQLWIKTLSWFHPSQQLSTTQHHQEGSPGGSREVKGAAASPSTAVTFSLMHVFMSLKPSMLLNPLLSSQKKASTSQTTVQSSEGEIESQNQACRSHCQWCGDSSMQSHVCVSHFEHSSV